MNMRKMILAIAVAYLSAVGVSAQSEKPFYGLGNRVGVGIGVGTEGIGIDAATSFNKYFGVRLGLNIMPDINLKTNVDVESNVDTNYGSTNVPSEVEVKGSLKRTTVDLKFDCYPFPNASSFFVTAGFSMGGSKLVKVTGHSDELAKLREQAENYGIQIGDYNIPFNDNGDVEGGLKVNGFRPYLGLGFGRLVPKGRVGMRFEMGVQFHGKPKVYAEGVDADDLLNQLDKETSDDISKIMDNFKVWPVLKLSIRGRIL